MELFQPIIFKFRHFITLCSLCIFSIPIVAQVESKSYEKECNYIYLLTRYLESPDYADDVHFIIGVYSNQHAFKAMENFFKNKRYVNKEIKVKFVTTLSELSTCNMLFIPSAKKNVTEKLIKHSLKSSIIIITEENTDKSKGSCINFSEKNGKLSIEINKEEMTNRKIIMNQALEPYFIK